MRMYALFSLASGTSRDLPPKTVNGLDLIEAATSTVDPPETEAAEPIRVIWARLHQQQSRVRAVWDIYETRGKYVVIEECDASPSLILTLPI